MAYDVLPIACIDNRHRYYSHAIPERWLTVFTHDPDTPWAYVSRDSAGRYVAEPLASSDDQISITSANALR